MEIGAVQAWVCTMNVLVETQIFPGGAIEELSHCELCAPVRYVGAATAWRISITFHILARGLHRLA